MAIYPQREVVWRLDGQVELHAGAEILETNREAVINLRDALIEHKVVEADAVAELLS
ncbi:MAG: hypothetical protein RIF41_40040 [Polyangiaceae bacterium]